MSYDDLAVRTAFAGDAREDTSPGLSCLRLGLPSVSPFSSLLTSIGGVGSFGVVLSFLVVLSF